jgi:RNA polymerase sigma factor (sigma-70 family)
VKTSQLRPAFKELLIEDKQDIDDRLEKELAERVHTDQDSFLELYNRYFPRVFNYIHYRTLDKASTEDLTSMVFQTALENIARFDAKKAPFGAWLFGIARNLVGKHLRQRKRFAGSLLEEMRDTSDHGSSPELAFLEKELQKELALELLKLNDRERELLSLKFGAQLKNRQIAKELGLSESSVAVSLFRILKKVRQFMGAEVD